MYSDPSLETDARAAIKLDEAERLLSRFASLTRESGTPDEHTAGEYIADRLRAFGDQVTVHRPDLILSIPERSELRLSGNGGGDAQSIASRPPAFALSTAGAEVSGELCYVPSKYAAGTGDLFDTPSAAAVELAADPVAGKIVLTEGYSMP